MENLFPKGCGGSNPSLGVSFIKREVNQKIMKGLLFLVVVFLVGCTSVEEVYDIDLTVKPYPIKKGVETSIDFKIAKDGNPVSLEIDHERMVHILTVREDLEEFKHIHHEDFNELTEENEKNAEFNIKNTFAEAAKYAIVFEFTTAGKTLHRQLELNVEGQKKELIINKDSNWIKVFGEYGVEFIPLESIEGPLIQKQSEIKAGEKTALLFRVIKDGNFVDNLEPYLGSAAHFIVWKEDLNQFMHQPAYVPISGQSNFGPNLPVELTFPEPGFYKIFIQFKHQGEVIIGDFWIEAK